MSSITRQNTVASSVLSVIASSRPSHPEIKFVLSQSPTTNNCLSMMASQHHDAKHCSTCPECDRTFKTEKAMYQVRAQPPTSHVRPLMAISALLHEAHAETLRSKPRRRGAGDSTHQLEISRSACTGIPYLASSSSVPDMSSIPFPAERLSLESAESLTNRKNDSLALLF